MFVVVVQRMEGLPEELDDSRSIEFVVSQLFISQMGMYCKY